MAGTDYTVNYRINVESGTSLATIQNFSQAVTQLVNMTSQFDQFTHKIGKVNAALKSINTKPITLSLSTKAAEASLNRVLLQLKEIKAQSKITLGVTGGRKGSTTIAGVSPLNTRSAASDLGNLQKTILSTHKSIDNLNKRYIHPKAQTKTAQANLDKLLATINAIKSQSNLRINVTGGGSVSKAATGATRGATPVGTKRAAAPTGGHSKLLYPSTRQVLGPTYAGTGASFVGEMVKGMGITYGLSAAMSGVTSIFKDATEYQNISQTTKNILATHDQSAGFESNFNSMNQLMRQVGVDTRYTAPQVAAAGKYLAMAGYKVGDISRAIRPITDIALIGDSDLGETADVVTNIMTSYELPAQKTRNAADMLTMTFTKTNTTLMELAESFKYAGTLAHQANLDFGITSAAFGVMGDAGIKGSQAGTTLRMMLLNLMNPTKKQREAWETAGISPRDSNGNLRNFVDIISELSEKSKTMSSGSFTSMMSRMFRITAVPGALALVNNVDKLREVAGLNAQSEGISSELSLAKQNTIQGLWHQMTSAFTESGMKGFESMQNSTKSFLQEMIKIMKSDEFAKALRDIMDLILKVTKNLVGMVSKITKAWGALPQIFKNGFVVFFQVQMWLGTITKAAQSLMSTLIVIRGIIKGDWLLKSASFLAAFGGVPFGALAVGSKKLLRGKVGNKVKYAIGGAYLSWLKLQRKAGMAGTVGNLLDGKVLGKVGGAAATSVAASAAGGVAAKAAASTGAFSLWGILKTVMLLAKAHPITALVSTVGSALAGLGYYWFKAKKNSQSVLEMNHKLAQSYKSLGIDKLNLANRDDLIFANMRIFNSEILMQQGKINESIRLFKEYRKAKNNMDKPIDDQTPYSETTEGKETKIRLNEAKQLNSLWKTKSEVASALGFYEWDWWSKGRTKHKVQINGQTYTTYDSQLGFLQNQKLAEVAKTQLEFANHGASIQNKKFQGLKDYYERNLFSANDFEDFVNLMQIGRNKYLPQNPDSTLNQADAKRALSLSESEFEKSPVAQMSLRRNQENLSSMYQNMWGTILQSVDRKRVPEAEVLQTFLMKRYGGVFNPIHGVFGTPAWVAKWQRILAQPTNFGFESRKAVLEDLQDAFQDLINFYSTLANSTKPLFSTFLNRDFFAKISKDIKLAPGGYSAGVPDIGSTMTINGKKYTYKTLGPSLIPQWFDENGSPYIYQSGDNPYVTNPSWTGGGGTTDQSGYDSPYKSSSAAPKQVIVRIQNLMNVDNIDLTNPNNEAVINNFKDQMASALLEVVQDFNSNI